MKRVEGTRLRWERCAAESRSWNCSIFPVGPAEALPPPPRTHTPTPPPHPHYMVLLVSLWQS